MTINLNKKGGLADKTSFYINLNLSTQIQLQAENGQPQVATVANAACII